jgi:hypothetical protein
MIMANSKYKSMSVYNQNQNDFDTVFEYIFDKKNEKSLKTA